MTFSKKAEKLCKNCRRYKALFIRRGEHRNKVRHRADHDLCQRCFRAANNKAFSG